MVYGVVKRVVICAQVVVQIGARPQLNARDLRVLVVVPNHLSVAPGLIGGVHDAPVGASCIGLHESVEALDLVQLFPLL